MYVTEQQLRDLDQPAYEPRGGRVFPTSQRYGGGMGSLDYFLRAKRSGDLAGATPHSVSVDRVVQSKVNATRARRRLHGLGATKAQKTCGIVGGLMDMGAGIAAAFGGAEDADDDRKKNSAYAAAGFTAGGSLTDTICEAKGVTSEVESPDTPAPAPTPPASEGIPKKTIMYVGGGIVGGIALAWLLKG